MMPLKLITMYIFSVTIHPRIRKSRQGGPDDVIFFESSEYFTEGRTDLLEEQLDPMGPIASRRWVRTSISKETYKHL